MVGGRAITEASGRITLETIVAVAASGVDVISVGWLTHALGQEIPTTRSATCAARA